MQPTGRPAQQNVKAFAHSRGGKFWPLFLTHDYEFAVLENRARRRTVAR
jgi:hypothetical protein